MTAKGWNKSATPQKKVFTLASALSVIALSILTVAPVQAQRNNNIFTGDFESGTFAGWDIHEACCQHSHSLVTRPVRNGSYAYRSLLKKGDPLWKNDARAEIQLKPFPKNSERWVGVSIYFPQAGDKGGSSIFQFHIKPDPGQSWTSPPFQMVTNNDQITIKRFGNATTGSLQKWAIGTVTPGKWMDFVFHIKGSSTTSGLFEAWMNGVQKVRYQGITTVPRLTGHFVKMGLYKGRRNQVTTDTAIYYDEFRIGNENATYKDVVPSGSPITD